MPRIKDIFHIINGVQASELEVKDAHSEGHIPLRCPSSSYDGTLAGYVHKNEVPANRIFPKDTIMVSTDGQGSHTYSYVTTEEFVANSNVVVLIPRVPMGLKEKILYALIITKNRPLFSYGRKPKGARLANVKLPEVGWIRQRFQDQLEDTKIPDFSHFKKAKSQENVELKAYKLFDIHTIFKLTRQKGPSVEWVSENPGQIPFISATKFNNGISGYCVETLEFGKVKGHCLTIQANGTDIGTCFYQEDEFYATNDVLVARPRQKLTKESLLYCSLLISKNIYRFNYGRKFNGVRTHIKISLPTVNGVPDWDGIDRFIRTCKYSATV